MSKIIINSILILVLILLEISFLPFFYPLKNLSLALIIIIFIELFIDYKIAFLWAVSVGLIFDLFSLTPFPLITIFFILTVAAIKFLSSNLFNPKSFLNYLLIFFLAILFFDLLLILTKYLANFFSYQLNFDQLTPQNFCWQIFLNLISFSFLFLILTKINPAKFKFTPTPRKPRFSR